MTSERLAIVREFSEAVASADYERFSATLDPDVVMYGTLGGLEQDRVVRGQRAVVDYFREIAETWEQLDATIERVVEAGDVAVVFLRERARSPHSDVEILSDTAVVVEVRNGKIIEVRGYMNRDEALKAARISA